MPKLIPFILSLLIAGHLTTESLAKPTSDPYQLIDSQALARDVLQKVQGQLSSFFNMSLRTPVEIHLVEGKEMDRLLGQSPYHGAEIGLYTGITNGKHQIYVMKGWARDYASGITAHELTHAWQQENAPFNQEQVIKEGFASWIEYQYYDKIGAYSYAQRTKQQSDPVYGVGMQAMLDAEDAIGVKAMCQQMRRTVTLKDLPKPVKSK